ncbi:dnak suppressor protein [Bacillus sp. OxB-1]|uniref:TraR/DksA C4-type zinc finger protein n=1 Tax=Bacillus sp. (strain OxB-1) TaxID=98228 RepID=UPI00058233AD|nr:TraR/DksA C4-type zinc finger protein [Bacillus sp. OxB-1]BAQ08487.1 dnak suppressor protein [Bacillus sp. OxB-1]
MLTDQQKQTLKQELLMMKRELRKTERETNLKDSSRDEVGELSMYDNHPGDMGTELFEREKDLALNIHAEGELGKVEQALQALEDGSYGKCEVCQTEIDFERLEALPYTTVCIDHVPERERDVPSDRPSEEDILVMANPDTFADKRRSRDGKDSFAEIAASGTSETPSDFTGDYDDYNSLYDKGLIDGASEEIEEFTGTDMSGKGRGFIRSEEAQAYEERLDAEGLESPLGNIPYHIKDSYVDDEKK